jgi:hypothetical protein
MNQWYSIAESSPLIPPIGDGQHWTVADRGVDPALLHKNTVTIAPIIVAEVADREIAVAPVERLSGEILVLHHQCNAVVIQYGLDGREQRRSQAVTAISRLDTEIEHPCLLALPVADDTAEYLLATPGDEDLRPWPEMEHEQRRDPVRLASLEAVPLEISESYEVP